MFHDREGRVSSVLLLFARSIAEALDEPLGR